ncbi:hypothetical protein [Haloferula sargassicola]|uniref:Lipoprotein n=1 Tax=Haloferula sargassicola TaxID=490096 RepID=A0ABP9UQR4_9BACT
MKTWYCLLLSILALALSSCLEHKSTLSLNKDGSGTITEETTLSAEASAMVEQMSAMGGEAKGNNWADRDKAEKRAKEMGEGVTVKEVAEIDKDGRKGGRVVFAFEDVNKLKYTPGDSLSDMSEGMGPQEEKPESEPVKMTYEDGLLTIVNPEPAKTDKPDAPAQEIDPSQLEMAKGMFDGMRITSVLVLPGGIKETNASYVDGDTITLMDMDMGKLVAQPEKFRKFAAAQPETLDDMKELIEGVDGIKVETAKKVTVRLK